MTETAIERLTRAAQQSPADAANWLALIELRRLEQREAAATALVRAVGLKPDWAEASHQMGLTLRELGDLEAATLCLERAADLSPDSPVLQRDFARLLVQKGDPLRAIGHYHCALSLDASPELLLEVAALLRTLGRHDSALVCYRKVMTLDPTCASVCNDAGNVLCELRRFDEAIAAYQRGLQLDPGFSLAYANLGVAFKASGLMVEAVSAFQKALELDPNDAATRGAMLFSLAYHPSYDARALLEEARKFSQYHVVPLHSARRPHTNDKNPKRKLRIGYVCSDFREHASTHFLLPLFERHDRSAYDFCAYSNVRDRDGWTERFRSKATSFRDIFEIDDAAAAELIRADRIDVLVDLTMHASNPRQLIFARTPAPVQVCWLAYPGTTGNDAIGYRLTDPFLDPPERSLDEYTERSVRLPRTFWCYDPLTTGPAVSALPARANGFVTFGCLNNFCKVSDPTIELWSRVLLRVKGSRLLLLAPRGAPERRARAAFEQAGVPETSLEFVDRMPRPKYLATFGRIDLALDTLPYNGHTTSLDAAWMGVPTVTLAGGTVAGRAGVTLAMNLGLPQLVTRTADDFVSRSEELASGLPALSNLRQGLRARLQSSPLMDTRTFARDIEAAYRSMWRQWCDQP